MAKTGLSISAGDESAFLDHLARELYHQLNFIFDIQASSKAVTACLKPIESGDLDDTFALVNGELLRLASEVSQGCVTSRDECTKTKEILDVSRVSFENIQKTLSDLVEASERIQRVADVIETFARQTRMVSMNAQVEAARAGEHGRGFAVVATEVGRLADSIRSESDQIQGAVESIAERTRGARDLVDHELDNNVEQAAAVNRMVNVANHLSEHGSQLPGIVAKLDQFLDPLEKAREAGGHNGMIQVAAGNVNRNLASLHKAIRKYAPSEVGVGVCSIEGYVDRLAQAMVEGDDSCVEGLTTRMLDSGHEPTACLDAVGIAVHSANVQQKHRQTSVGEHYFNFLLVEQVLEEIESRIGDPDVTGMKMVIGNARGDYHSLGRQMVGLFLRASGIEVIDVGLGASAESFVQAAVESGARVIGVSSLLVESAKEIKRIRTMLDERGLKSTKIIAGGACFVVDREFHAEVGADYVATAASDAVSIVQEVYGYQPMRNMNGAGNARAA